MPLEMCKKKALLVSQKYTFPFNKGLSIKIKSRDITRFKVVVVTGGQAKGPLTIRRTPHPSFLVNFSTFAFLLNFSFMK